MITIKLQVTRQCDSSFIDTLNELFKSKKAFSLCQNGKNLEIFSKSLKPISKLPINEYSYAPSIKNHIAVLVINYAITIMADIAVSLEDTILFFKISGDYEFDVIKYAIQIGGVLEI